MKRIILLWIVATASAAHAAEPDQLAGRAVVQLSLRKAVQLGLSPEGNASLQLSGEEVRQAHARSAQARAALLPDLEGSAGVQSVTRNLAAMGVRLDQDLPGWRIPHSVGPFNVVDARVSMTRSVLDLSAVRRYQASRIAVRAARAGYSDTRDQAASRIAHHYLAALRAEASLEAVNENVRLAEAILKQAETLSTAGTGTGIEVTRARVLLANETQRLLVAENDQSRARQELLRAMGMRLDIAVELTDTLTYVPAELPAFEDAKAEALRSRSDFKAQLERQEQARLTSSAAKFERAPSVKAFADYGSLGTGISSAIPTRSVGISVQIPLFDGGRRQARTAESESQYRQEKVRLNDLRDQIDLQVRLALDALRSTDQEVTVASEGLTLAEKELSQARRRYEVGLANSVEVADAQARLATARDNRVVALYRHNVARIELAEATGTIESIL